AYGSRLPGSLSLPLAPLLFALVRARRPAARWGPSFGWGAANLPSDLGWTKGPKRSQPRIDGYAQLSGPGSALILHITVGKIYPSLPLLLVLLRPAYAAAVASGSFRNGSYTSPLT